MKYFISLLKTLGIMFAILFISLLIFTTLNYFDIINNKFLTILEILTIIMSTTIGGLLFGKSSKEKGWLEGIKLGTIFIFLLFIIDLLFIHFFSFKILFYDLILILSTMIGSMIGISKKTNN